jgi:hypothetical protein
MLEENTRWRPSGDQEGDSFGHLIQSAWLSGWSLIEKIEVKKVVDLETKASVLRLVTRPESQDNRRRN